MFNAKIRNLWRHITIEAMTGAGSLGAYYDRRTLTMVHMQKGFAAPQVLHTAQWPLSEDDIEALAPHVAETIAVWGASGAPVSLAVSTQLGFLRQVPLPLAARENLAKVVSYEIDRFLPLGADRLVFDYQIAQQSETDITLALTALPRECIEGWLRLCADIGLKPIAVELACTAAANAFALLGERLPYSWLLFRAGEADFDLAQIQGNILRHWHSRRMAPGAGVMAEVAAEIGRLTGEGAEPAALCLYGQGALKVRTSTLMEQFSFPVIRESQIMVKSLELNSENAAQFLPALGAALRGVGKVPVKTNLLPASERAIIKFTGLFLTRVLLILLLSLGVIWMGSVFIHQKISLALAERQLASLHPAVLGVEKKLTETQALGKQLQDIQKRIEENPSTLVVLKELTQIIPDHTHLFTLRLKKGQVELGGKSNSAADLISIMEQSGYFTKTEFVSPIVTDDTGSEIFKIKAEIRGAGRGS
jgi:Tfp pilus assembly protein PilN